MRARQRRVREQRRLAVAQSATRQSTAANAAGAGAGAGAEGSSVTGRVRRLVAQLVPQPLRTRRLAPYMTRRRRRTPFAAGVLYQFKRGLYDERRHVRDTTPAVSWRRRPAPRTMGLGFAPSRGSLPAPAPAPALLLRLRLRLRCSHISDRSPCFRRSSACSSITREWLACSLSWLARISAIVASSRRSRRRGPRTFPPVGGCLPS